MAITVSYYGGSKPDAGAAPQWQRGVPPDLMKYYQGRAPKGQPADIIYVTSPNPAPSPSGKKSGLQLIAESRARLKSAESAADARRAERNRQLMGDVIQRDKLPFGKVNPISPVDGRHVLRFGKDASGGSSEIALALPATFMTDWRLNKATHRFQVKTFTVATGVESDWVDVSDENGGILDPGVTP